MTTTSVLFVAEQIRACVNEKMSTPTNAKRLSRVIPRSDTQVVQNPHVMTVPEYIIREASWRSLKLSDTWVAYK